MDVRQPGIWTLPLILFLAACKPDAGPSPGTPASHESERSVLASLHSAAENMALDGFQFGKAGLGWPHDVGAATGAAYFAVLRENNYLPDDVPASITVANVAEIDPLDTALFKIRHLDGSEVAVRKDGIVDQSAADPPRDPAWLP